MGNSMRKGTICLFAAALAVVATPALAMHWGCDDQHNRANISRSISQSNASVTHEFSAQSQRPRITIYPRQTSSPGRLAKRQCRSELVREYRVSGTVIVPRMQCWWE